jgi:anaphase-promoting complex subunit 4
MFCLSGIDNTVKVYDSNNGKLLKVVTDFCNIGLVSWNVHKYSATSKFEDLYSIDIILQLPKLLSFPSTLNYLVIADETDITINFNNCLTVKRKIDSDGEIVGHLQNNDLFKQVFVLKKDGLYRFLCLNSKLSSLDMKYLLTVIHSQCKLIGLITHIESQFTEINDQIVPFLQLFDKYFGLLLLEYPGEPKSVIKNYFANYILTGLIEKTSKDFWLNQFGVRGYKRLSTLGNSCYDNLRKIIFSQIILAIERVIIITNELLGLAKWVISSENSFNFGLNPPSLEKLLQVSGKVLKQAYKYIQSINDEQALFNNFFDMTKHELIDKLAKEDELDVYYAINKSFDYSQVLKYINKNMFHSILVPYSSIDLKDYEILQPTESKEDEPTIIDIFDKVNACNGELIDSFKQFFPCIFSNEEGLEFEGFENISIKSIDDETTVVCGMKEQAIELMKITSSFDIIATKRVVVSGLINYRLDENHLIFLYKDKIVQIDTGDIWRSRLQAVELNSVNYSEIHVTIDNPGIMATGDCFGCVLDENKQNYMVFKTT